jgi:hypothetical protein
VLFIVEQWRKYFGDNRHCDGHDYRHYDRNNK